MIGAKVNVEPAKGERRIADYLRKVKADGKEGCTIEELVLATGLSRRSVDTYIGWLVEEGAIESRRMQGSLRKVWRVIE